MYKKHTNFIFALSILITLIAGATLFFFFHIIKNKNQHTSNLATTLADKITKKKNETDLEKKVADIKATENAVSSHFVNSAEIDSFIGYLEGLGEITNAKVKVKGFIPSPSNQGILNVDLIAGGSFNSIMRTIMFLENSQYQIHITNTYLDHTVEQVVTDSKNGSTTSEVSSWQAAISFSVLIST